MLKLADLFLRSFLLSSWLLCLTCTPSNASSKAAEQPPPPQCVVSYFFVDQDGENAFICVYDDTSEDSWNGYGAAVYHPYLDGFIVGLTIDLQSFCSGETPVCAVVPSTACVTPPQFWSADGNPYALCRTNDGDDSLAFFWEGPRATWYALDSWNTALFCSDATESDDPDTPTRE